MLLLARGRQQLARNVEALEAKGATAVSLPADVTDERQVQDAFDLARQRFGRVDLLVNNAGEARNAPIDELSVDDWDQVIALNLRGPFLCTREALRLMKQTGGGRIINISSLAARRVRPHSAPYAASKAGLWGLTQVTALEGREFGISCGCIFPGNTLVERLRNRAEPMMTVPDLVQAVVAMATLPAHVNLLEAVILPVGQPYLGRA